jgi:hypothetical protein
MNFSILVTQANISPGTLSWLETITILDQNNQIISNSVNRKIATLSDPLPPGSPAIIVELWNRLQDLDWVIPVEHMP